jgi:hypothetical protein
MSSSPTVSARQAIGDRVLGAGGLLILVAAVAAIDERVREQAAMLLHGGAPIAGAADLGGRVGDLVETAFRVARAWSVEHVYLAIFAAAGAALLFAVRKL